VKVALLSNINMDLMVPRLEKYLDDAGIRGDFHITGFNQYIQEMINPNSTLNTGEFDAAVLFIDGEELFQNIIYDPLKYKKDDIDRLIDSEIKNISLQIKSAVNANGKITFFVNNLFIRRPTILGAMDYNAEFAIAGLQDRFNSRVQELKASDRVVIIDFAGFVSRYGYEMVYDNRLWHIGRIKFSSQGLKSLSELYCSYMQAYLGKSKKVLVLDLDNTLWGGVIGEDGINGIKLGNEGIGRAYHDFQKLIRVLKHKGILLCICSKNNLTDVREVFEKNEFMELKEDDFVALKINWENKIKNIKDIAAELNLGTDSFVFIDDNPFEREMVKSEIPQVIVPDFPEDPVNLSRWFIDLSFKYFNNVIITNEDKLRTEIYHADSNRKKMEGKAATLEDFYESLDMRAVIRIDSRDDFKRIAQLTQRTNQFNLTTRRYSENEVLAFMNSKDWMVLSLELNDRFGPNGIIGVMIVKIEGQNCYIDTFLLSCRVIGRTVEHFFIHYLIEMLRKRAIEKVIGEYIPSHKNSAAKYLYKKNNFKLLGKNKNDSESWVFNIAEDSLEKNEWIQIDNSFCSDAGENKWTSAMN